MKHALRYAASLIFVVLLAHAAMAQEASFLDNFLFMPWTVGEDKVYNTEYFVVETPGFRGVIHTTEFDPNFSMNWSIERDRFYISIDRHPNRTNDTEVPIEFCYNGTQSFVFQNETDPLFCQGDYGHRTTVPFGFEAVIPTSRIPGDFEFWVGAGGSGGIACSCLGGPPTAVNTELNLTRPGTDTLTNFATLGQSLDMQCEYGDPTESCNKCTMWWDQLYNGTYDTIPGTYNPIDCSGGSCTARENSNTMAEHNIDCESPTNITVQCGYYFPQYTNRTDTMRCGVTNRIYPVVDGNTECNVGTDLTNAQIATINVSGDNSNSSSITGGCPDKSQEMHIQFSNITNDWISGVECHVIAEMEPTSSAGADIFIYDSPGGNLLAWNFAPFQTGTLLDFEIFNITDSANWDDGDIDSLHMVIDNLDGGGANALWIDHVYCDVTYAHAQSPNNPTANLSTEDNMQNLTTEDLFCTGTLSDDHARRMNSTVTWYVNQTVNESTFGPLDVVNNTFINVSWDNTNTEPLNNITCGIRTVIYTNVSDEINSSTIEIKAPPTADTCTPPATNNDWEVDLADFCVIGNQTIDLGTGNLIHYGSGMLRFDNVNMTMQDVTTNESNMQNDAIIRLWAYYPGHPSRLTLGNFK